MEFVAVADCDKTKYMDLLLIADEQVSMIEKYLYRGDMYALWEGDLKALCVVTRERPGVHEIKNLVTAPQYQRRGYGRRMIACIENRYREDGGELYVGTGDSPATLIFYQKCGFEKSHIVKDFFVDNYDHPIYEGGKQLRDMVYLKKRL